MTSQNEIVGVEYSQFQFKKAKSMPSYHKHKKACDGKYTVAIYPTGIRKCLRFLPYYNGSTVSLAVSAQNTSQQTRRLSYHYVLYRCDEQNQKEKQVDTRDGEFNLEPKWENDTKISKYLVVPGEYYATLDLSESGSSLVQGLHMAGFRLLSKDAWVGSTLTVIVASIISCIIGIIIGWVVAVTH